MLSVCGLYLYHVIPLFDIVTSTVLGNVTDRIIIDYFSLCSVILCIYYYLCIYIISMRVIWYSECFVFTTENV